LAAEAAEAGGVEAEVEGVEERVEEEWKKVGGEVEGEGEGPLYTRGLWCHVTPVDLERHNGVGLCRV
jgi:hypothetical protein